MAQRNHQRSYPQFSAAEYDRRLAAVRSMMQREGVDALVIYANSKGQCSNIHYLANYLGQFHNYLVVFADPDEDPTLFVGLTNHVAYGREISVIEDVRWGGFPPMETVVERIDGTAAARGRIGLVGPSPRFDILLPHGHYRTLDEKLDAELVDVSGAYASLQLIKSAEELERIRTASRFVDSAMEALSETVAPGTDEHELRNIAQSAYLPAGGTPGINFVSTASMHDPEPGACYPWKDEPAPVAISRGDIITTEISASYWGYKGQLHRPIAVGESPPPQYRSLFDTVLETHENLLDALRPGATAADIVDATSPITEAGYRSPDAILHGYGMSLHPPWIGTVDSNYWPNLDDPHTVPNDEFEFAEDMVVVIQPNAVTEDGRFGLQFGSTVHITDSGSTLLTEYPLEFVQA